MLQIRFSPALIVCVLLLLSGPRGLAQKPASDLVFSEIGSMTEDLERLTGWKAKRPVRAEWISRERVRHFLEQRIKKAVKPEDLRIEKMLLVMLGFAPADFDLARTTIDLMTEQAAAFYDYEKKRLYVLDSNESVLERRTTLVHELAHALADQHHSLKRYLRDNRVSDDEALARESVVEGQATWLMWAWESERNTGRAEVSDAVLESARSERGPDERAFPVLARVPLYMREALTFPYTAGLLFHDDLYRRRGRGSFDEAFVRPPSSTRHILHPETYVSNVEPVAMRFPVVLTPARRKLLAEGTLGEMDLQVLLNQYTPELVKPLASQWRGGEFRLEEEKGSGSRRPVLTFGFTMESPEAARALLAAYRKVLPLKWKQFEVTESTADRLKGRGDFGPFETWIDGPVMVSIEGGQLK